MNKQARKTRGFHSNALSNPSLECDHIASVARKNDS